MAGFNKRPKSRRQGISVPAASKVTAKSEGVESKKQSAVSAASEREFRAEDSKQLFSSTAPIKDMKWDEGEDVAALAASRAEKKRLEEQQIAAKKAEERRRAEEERKAEELRKAEEERRAAAKARKAAEEERRRIEEERRRQDDSIPERAKDLGSMSKAPERKFATGNLTSELFLDKPPVKHDTTQLSVTNTLYLSGTRQIDGAPVRSAAKSPSGQSMTRPAGSAVRSPSGQSASRSAPARKSEAQNVSKKKRPNIFIRILHAIFPCKGDGVAESVRKIIFDVAVVAFVITGGSVLLDIFDEYRNSTFVDKAVVDSYRDDIDDKASVEEIKGSLNLTDDEISTIQKEKPGINYSFMQLYNENPDIVGWIRVGNTDDPVINYPVVQCEDNDYYLTHNFKKEESKRGAIYADYRCDFTDGRLSGNTVLYGHNMWNGDTMFAKVSRYYDGRLSGDYADRLGFYKENPTITFNTLYENSEWKVFACVFFNTQPELGEVYPYNNVISFPNKDSFNSFVLDLMDRSVLWTDVDLTYGDEILTLSTCWYPWTKEVADTRVAVFARKVRDGESASVDVSKAVTNTNPLKFDFQYRKEGGEWKGRTWDTSKLLSYEP